MLLHISRRRLIVWLLRIGNGELLLRHVHLVKLLLLHRCRILLMTHCRHVHRWPERMSRHDRRKNARGKARSSTGRRSIHRLRGDGDRSAELALGPVGVAISPRVVDGERTTAAKERSKLGFPLCEFLFHICQSHRLRLTIRNGRTGLYLPELRSGPAVRTGSGVGV